ncbi:MAG TPA: hypothetical protein VGI22_27525, partial [Xanthobacteraceae bacterium]
ALRRWTIAAAALSPHRAPRRNSNQAKINREPPRRHLATQSRPRACQAKVVPSTRNYYTLFWVNKKG